MKKFLFTILSCILFLNIFGQTDSLKKETKSQKYFNINQSINIFNSLVRDVDMLYVDSLNIKDLVEKGISNMLSNLDPYTEYYPPEKAKDLEILTTGKYAGIGSLIAYNKERVIINEPKEGLPAQKAGLKAGDIIVKIDGKNIEKLTPLDQVSSMLLGPPETTVKLEIERPGEKQHKLFNIVRKKINVPPIPYYSSLDNGVGYIKLESFTENSSQEFKNTFIKLKKDNAKSLIIDLRGNGGGILQDAINIINVFVPKDKNIVAIKGKIKDFNLQYKTKYEPIDTIMPITVLIDTFSASASEIVAGSLQDLDRAVVVGNKSYGKGLVQTPRALPYGSVIKITTSKYYIPSGRCIQKLNYSHKTLDGSSTQTPDSLKNMFKTSNGRIVREGSGIIPDVIVNVDRTPSMVESLYTQNIIFNYVTGWCLKHPKIKGTPETFTLTDSDYQDFVNFVKKEDFKYNQISKEGLSALKEAIKFEGYLKDSEKEIKALEEKLKPNLDRDLDMFKKNIKKLIESSIIQRYYFQKGVIQYILKDDVVLNKALEILKNKEEYNNILIPKKS